MSDENQEMDLNKMLNDTPKEEKEKTKNKLDKKIIYKSTGKEYSELRMSMPGVSYKTLMKQLEDAPKIDSNASPDLREWKKCIGRAVNFYHASDVFHDSLNTSGKKFSNSFMTKENVELTTAPIKGIKASKSLQGEQAEIHFRQRMGRCTYSNTIDSFWYLSSYYITK
jgi:hypothetical protein